MSTDESGKPGVKTEIGKAKVRHNAFKHGLTAKALISDLSNLQESEAEYLAIVDGLRESFQPRNYFEEGLIEQMAKAQFKSRRFDIFEATLFNDREVFIPGRSLNEALEVSYPEQFQLALKYKQAIESQYYRALIALQQSRQPKQMDLFLPEGGVDGVT
jgi:hypothetical protein